MNFWKCPNCIGFQPVSSVDDGWFSFWFEEDDSGSPGHKKRSWLVARYRLEAYATLLSGLAREVLKSYYNRLLVPTSNCLCGGRTAGRHANSIAGIDRTNSMDERHASKDVQRLLTARSSVAD